MQGVAALVLEIALAYPRAAHQQVAERLPVPGQRHALGIDDFHVDTKNGAPGPHLYRAQRSGIQPLVLELERAHRAKRTHLGHAPGVQHLHAIVILEAVYHRRRTGRPANDHALQL